MEKVVVEQGARSVLDPVSAGGATQQEGEKVLRNFNQGNSSAKRTYLYVVVGLVVVLGGALTGRMLAEGRSVKTSDGSGLVIKDGEVAEAGGPESEFTDEPAEGMLIAGGVEDEGTHHLDRGMGPEKDVYLFSTSLDLTQFEGKKVKVWGHSLTSRKVPWLMDVGRITVLE